jgi:hypothetical protein
MLIGVVLAYLRDPPWIANLSEGLRPWEEDAAGTRYRWSGGHASFFVPSDAAAIRIPVATTFDGRSDPPILVVVTVDDVPAARIVLADPAWDTLMVPLPPRSSRTFRRIDIRTNVTRADNHGIKIGTVEILRRQVAAKLLGLVAEHGSTQKLNQAIIDERILFPDLDGLSRWLTRYYLPARRT